MYLQWEWIYHVKCNYVYTLQMLLLSGVITRKCLKVTSAWNYRILIFTRSLFHLQKVISKRGEFLFVSVSTKPAALDRFLCFIVLKMSCSSSQRVTVIVWDYESNICAFCFRAFSEICVWSDVRGEDSKWQTETETKWIGKMKVRQTRRQNTDGGINENEMWRCNRSLMAALSRPNKKMNKHNANSQTQIIPLRFDERKTYCAFTAITPIIKECIGNIYL